MDTTKWVVLLTNIFAPIIAGLANHFLKEIITDETARLSMATAIASALSLITAPWLMRMKPADPQ